MRKAGYSVLMLLVCGIAPHINLFAQSIAVSPSMPYVPVKGTVQFSATATGLAGGVTWLAGGKVGGNATSGTISATGLYTAPAALPGQNPVQITARSTSNTKISGSTYVNIESLGPVVSSVTPNPLAVGTINVTVRGQGFVLGAEIYVSYGSQSLVQLSTTAVTSSTVAGTGYVGPSSSATFSVRNPGSTYSNSITVPVVTLYSLTVTNGTGSGNYAAGAVVTITANSPPAGEVFQDWTGATVANANASTTTLVMPAATTTVKAHYTTPTYTLTVVGGTGSGSYTAGTVVTIKANAPPSGDVFADWTGFTVASATSATTTLTMPAASTTVTANFSATPTYALTVVNGTGSGHYAAGTVITITANAPPSGDVFADWTGFTVASATAATTTLTMPAASTTVTANFSATPTYALTVVNGTGSGHYAAGTVITITANTPPSGDVFADWTGFTVASANSATTTLTMPASSATVTATYSGSPSIPFPVSTHPRLWITANDLPRLQSWATASNPTYVNGMQPMLATAVDLYQTQFFPGGAPNSNYPDPGDVQGYTGYLTEQYAAILAFNSLIDPNPANRITYAQYARNMLMYAINQAALGHLANAPFRDPAFAVYNRANFSGEQWPLIVDWIYNAVDASGHPILTAADKAAIQNVFLQWANDCLNAETTGGDHPSPVGVMNSLELLPSNQPYRMASNNYYLGHARLVTMMALSLDPTDDPPADPTQPVSALGNSVRSYIQDATGAWLYQEFAMMGDPSVVPAAYGLPANTPGFGLASGGMPPEGMLYGHSFGFVLGQLLALETAGFNNTALAGPQIGLIGAPVWDRYVTGVLSSLTPTSFVPPSETWDGPVYQFDSYGDLLRLWVTPDFMQPYALLALLEAENGSTAHASAARWYVINVPQGGPGGLDQRLTDPWSTEETILYYLLLDPSAAAGADPRPNYPKVFYDPAAGRIVAHSDWTLEGTMFDYRASWISINHQLGDGGMFELFRKGEWLTKEMSNYDNNLVGMTTVYHNTLALQNWCADGTPASLQWYESGEWANGSQWMEGDDAGDPTTVFSAGPGYVYAASNLTNLFNRPDVWSPADAAVDVTQATRSIVWLNNDYVVIYDRATTAHSGLFKQVHFSLVNAPALNGNVATETMPDNQQLFIQTLLPQVAAPSYFNGAANLNPIADLEPTQYIYQVADPALPADTRFLHVLQGADPGVQMAPATYLQSTAGTAFDGAEFATMVVYFPKSATAPFTGTTLSAPAAAETMWVTGLAPNTTYGVSIQHGGSGYVVAIAAGGAGGTTDAAGVLELTL